MDHDPKNPNHPQDTSPKTVGRTMAAAAALIVFWTFVLYVLVIRPLFGG